MNLTDAHEAMTQLTRLGNEAIDELKRRAREYAGTERAYRKAKARAWLAAPKGTVPERKAWVDAETAELRESRDIAEGMKQAALEEIRWRRGQLSSWQSELKAFTEEVGMARFGPEMEP